MIYEHNIDPAFLRIGNIEFRWYGLMYVLGFLFAYFFLLSVSKRGKLKLNEDEIIDLVFYSFFGLVLGARLFYVIFYNFDYYMANPLDILFIWQGGLSFHGGLLGVMVAGLLFCKIYKKSFLNIADFAVIPVSLGLALGRIGNFINGELWGRPTNGSWGVIFPNSPEPKVPRHPSQIYEMGKNLIIFVSLIIFLLLKRNRKNGDIFALFLILYGILRFLVEFVREPEIVLYGLTMGQILTIPFVLFGLFLLFYTKKSSKKVN